MQNTYTFEAVLHEEADGVACIVFPFDLKAEFGKGRLKVHAEFNGISYDGSIVNMGVTDSAGNICYVLGVLKSIRKQLGMADGDMVQVVVRPQLTACKA